MKHNLFKCSTIALLYFVLTACGTPRVISIKQDSKTHENKLKISADFQKFELGIVLLKPWALSFSGSEIINTLIFINEEGNTVWEIHSKEKNVGSAHITYGKLISKKYEQTLPLQNSPIEALKPNHKYTIKLETKRGKYEKQILIQPSQVYIYDYDMK